MTKTQLNKRQLRIFSFEYNNIVYNIDIQKLKMTLGILNIKIEENILLTNKTFEMFLKKHKLLVEEFLEHISIS